MEKLSSSKPVPEAQKAGDHCFNSREWPPGEPSRGLQSYRIRCQKCWGLPGWVKNPPANARDTEDMGSTPGLGRPPGGGNGNLVQYSWQGNPMDDGAWWATVLGITKRQTRLSMHTSGVLTPETEQWGSLKNGLKVTSTKQTLSSSDARASDLEATQTSLHSNISL